MSDYSQWIGPVIGLIGVLGGAMIAARTRKTGEREQALITALQEERRSLSGQISILTTDIGTLRNEVRDYYDHARSLEDVYYAIKFGLEDGTVPPVPPLPTKKTKRETS